MATQLTGPIAVAAQGLFESKTTALHNIGEYIVSNDGRGYRYAKAGGTALVVGTIQQAKAEDTSNEEEIAITNPTAGDLTVVTTSTVTLALNLLAGGFLLVSEGTLGVGECYRIKGNTAASGAVCTISLDEPIRTTVTGTAKVDMKLNPYQAIIIAPTTQTSCIVGAAQYAIPASEFGWVQTRGVCGILAQGTCVVGDGLVPANTTTAGTVVTRADASLEASIGYALHGAASTDYCLSFLTIN